MQMRRKPQQRFIRPYSLMASETCKQCRDLGGQSWISRSRFYTCRRRRRRRRRKLHFLGGSDWLSRLKRGEKYNWSDGAKFGADFPRARGGGAGQRDDDLRRQANPRVSLACVSPVFFSTVARGSREGSFARRCKQKENASRIRARRRVGSFVREAATSERGEGKVERVLTRSLLAYGAPKALMARKLFLARSFPPPPSLIS